MMSNKYRAEGFLLGTVVGGLVAGATALLLAPKSGKELRKDISDQAQDWKEQASDYAFEAKAKGQAYYEDAKDKGEELSKTAKQAANQYRDSTEIALQSAKEKLEKEKNTDGDIDVTKLTDELQDIADTTLERDKEITEDIIKQAKKDVNK